jgi:pimeloyl-ACP methyl ester carboxylesterase
MHRLLWLIILPLLLPVAGLLYQAFGARHDKGHLLGAGSLVRVGSGRRMYLYDAGSGGPAVVFESGIAATSQNWAQLQAAISGFTRVVSYDRAGLGWSSASDAERTPSNIVRELRALLLRAGVPPPYVLVGHSFGGLVVRHFAANYPQEVLGVVLVDAMRTEEWPPVNESQRAVLDRGILLTRIALPIARFGLARLATTSLLCRSGRTSRFLSRAAGSGGAHVLDRITCEVGKMPRDVWPIIAAHWSRPSFYRGLQAHLRAVPATVREMHDSQPIFETPVLLLNAANVQPLSTQGLRQIGTAAQQKTAHRSGHWIHLDEPELVVEAVRDMVMGARRAQPHAPGSLAAAAAAPRHSDPRAGVSSQAV